MKNILLYLSDTLRGNNKEIYEFLSSEYQVNKSSIEEIQNKYKESGTNFITVLNNEYPEDLFQNKIPPFVIYYKGNIRLLNTKNKFLICNEINNDKTDYFIQTRLNFGIQPFTLVITDFKKVHDKILERYSGIPYKRKIFIHCESLENVNLVTDEQKESELHLSLYPLNSHPKKAYFKQSNYLLAAVADALIIVSSNENTKIQGLVNAFLSYGKEIYCFPGLDINDGNTQFLREGAKLITKLVEIQ
ncbi:hypothetical protein [Mycoplasma buteonis]|uniref:hypothetical protein n=1 Tax=Mycoplasma buteonis TaxID=171280 RepID=UPI00056D7067|nr:hypothetical protein [Mycoplasma buteonis]